MLYPSNQSVAVKNALLGYQKQRDVKASAAVVMNYASGQVRSNPQCIQINWADSRQLVYGSFLFYDAPVPPQGLFDDFLAIPTVLKNISTQSFSELIASFTLLNPPPGTPSPRLVVYSTQLW